MNEKVAKKMRRELKAMQGDTVKSVFDLFDRMSFFDRLKICLKIMTRKL